MLVMTSLVLLAIGVFSPLMTLNKFYLFENQVSLFSALADLTGQGEWLLFLVIFVFSIIFPMIKILFLFLVLNTGVKGKPGYRRFMHVLASIGKWSMLDVFVVALLLVSVKLGVLANVHIHYGVYVFGISVLLTMLLTHWLNWIAAGTS
jgi:paraquat-inducible protein A